MSLPRPLARIVARAKPKIPAAVWPTLLAVRSLVGDGPVVGVPAFDRALVLVAHPDDEALACAGTMALLADAGATVTLLAATDGEGTIGSPHDPAETGRRRRAELARSTSLLGAGLEHLGLPDGRLHEHRAQLRTAFAAALDRLRPDVVFVPWLGDGHRDHRAVAFALADALSATTADLQVWGYETWSAVPHNRIVPIEAVIDRKRAAVAAHETGSLAFDLSAGLGLSRWHSMHGLLGEGHAEAFLAVERTDYIDLAEELVGFDDTALPEAGS
ncbi:PIG-L family deacetylase [Acidimicrobiia bacterium EGI L10123]|uniref:PIG-L deacetylase family protein n=1 Tax=Salinilacustrithrix flava TaxID=2957203 RepID=UPI003D7C3607|nr:PIG-L family deacetylase [Acidimicrobiia bacterium EGI L10123]